MSQDIDVLGESLTAAQTAERFAITTALPTELRIVFDGPPSHDAPRFVEVEDANGRSVSVGKWRPRNDGLWELVLAAPAGLPVESAQVAPAAARLFAANKIVAEQWSVPEMTAFLRIYPDELAALAAEPVKPQEPAAEVRPLLALLARWLSFHTESAGLSLETVEDTELLSAFLKAIEAKCDALAAETYAALAVKPQGEQTSGLSASEAFACAKMGRYVDGADQAKTSNTADRVNGLLGQLAEKELECSRLREAVQLILVSEHSINLLKLGNLPAGQKARSIAKAVEEKNRVLERAHTIANFFAKADPVPGMVLVPVEPTEAMVQAALDCQDADPEDGAAAEVYCGWKAMLVAAPKAVKPSPSQGEHGVLEGTD